MKLTNSKLAGILALSMLTQGSMADDESGRFPSASGGLYTVMGIIGAILLCCSIWAINRRCQSSTPSLEKQADRLHSRLQPNLKGTSEPSESEPLIGSTTLRTGSI